jgi:adenylate kinase family enzyme
VAGPLQNPGFHTACLARAVLHPDPSPAPWRLHLIGSSAAGKTTLGRMLARELGLPFVDLDELFWEHGWRSVGHDELTRRMAPTLALPGWVIVGNYRATTEPHVWPLVTHLLVLDLPLPTLLWRTTRRTLWRGLSGEPCCNGNRESLARFFHEDGLVRYLLRNWRSRHERQLRLAADPALAHARVLRFERTPTPAAALQRLREMPPPQRTGAG